MCQKKAASTPGLFSKIMFVPSKKSRMSLVDLDEVKINFISFS